MSSFPPSIPEVVQRSFDEICQEVNLLSSAWTQFKDLYNSGEEQNKLLNTLAPGFFVTVYDALLDKVLLNISVLTDPAKTGKKNNLSLKQLCEQFAEIDKGLGEQLNDLENDVMVKCASIRDYRNKLIAHRDLVAVISDPDFGLTVSSVDEAISSICIFLKKLMPYFGKDLDLSFIPEGDAEFLVKFVLIPHKNVLEMTEKKEIPDDLARKIFTNKEPKL
jgi:hypothetical protein